MKIISTTERLRLREMTPDDAVNAFHLNSDPEVVRYTGDEPFVSIEAAREFLQNYTDYRRNGYGRWAVERMGDGAFLGWCGLKKLDDGDVDLGYRLMREHWGNGYATEAARECLRIGFEDLGMAQIIGRTAEENVGSVRVLEKLGMQYYRTAQCVHDPVALYFRIGRDQWRAAHQPR